jgi:hypothetical protein
MSNSTSPHYEAGLPKIHWQPAPDGPLRDTLGLTKVVCPVPLGRRGVVPLTSRSHAVAPADGRALGGSRVAGFHPSSGQRISRGRGPLDDHRERRDTCGGRVKFLSPANVIHDEPPPLYGAELAQRLRIVEQRGLVQHRPRHGRAAGLSLRTVPH